MSKQYLTTHTLDDVHPADIFALAPTLTSLLSASGASGIKVHDTSDPAFPLQSNLKAAHKLGVHHITASENGRVAVSAGFGGEVKIWKCEDVNKGWREAGIVAVQEGTGPTPAGEIWAVKVTVDGRYLAGTSYDGKVRVWDLADGATGKVVRQYETKGSFGMCVDMTQDGKLVASGHENGNIYTFNNETGRMLHSLPGLFKAVRAVTYSPAATLLAAAGDSMVISLYDVSSGEQVANLSGHIAWVMSLDFSSTGEWLLSGSYDGKVKVWGMETRSCVATHGENEEPVWSARWLPKAGRSEMFVVAGGNKSISFYREASGG